MPSSHTFRTKSKSMITKSPQTKVEYPNNNKVNDNIDYDDLVKIWKEMSKQNYSIDFQKCWVKVDLYKHAGWAMGMLRWQWKHNSILQVKIKLNLLIRWFPTQHQIAITYPYTERMYYLDT